jgi:chromosome segregation ATPase
LKIPATASAAIEVLVRRTRPVVKFHCPECNQRISVDEGAAGVGFECPICHSTLKIPTSNKEKVEVVVRRRRAVPAKTADQALEELAQKKVDLARTLKEAEQLRTDKVLLQSELTKVCLDAATGAHQLKSVSTEVIQRNTELAEMRENLAAKEKTIRETRERLETVERTREELSTQLDRVTRDLEKGATQNGGALSIAREQLTALTRERDEMRAALEQLRRNLQAAEETGGKEAARARSIATFGEERISTITKERDGLAAQLRDAQREIRESLASIDALQREQHRAHQENTRLHDTLNVTMRERDALKDEAVLARNLAEKRDQEIQRLSEKIRADEAQLADFSATKSQLTEAQRQMSALSEDRDAFRIKTEKAEEQAANLRSELARMTEQLRKQETELRELGERATELDRQRNELQRRVDDPTLPAQLTRITDELTSVNAELNRVRRALESVTAERNQARVELTEQDAALRANAEAAFQKDRELAAATTKIDTLLRRLDQFEAQSKSLAATVTETAPASAAAASAAAAITAHIPKAGNDDNDDERGGNIVDRAERCRRLERELVTVSERLQAIKKERFALREQLAAKDDELRKAPANSDAASKARNDLFALQKKLEELQPAADRARNEYEILQAKLQAVRLVPRDATAATPVIVTAAPTAPPPPSPGPSTAPDRLLEPTPTRGGKAEKLKS